MTQNRLSPLTCVESSPPTAGVRVSRTKYNTFDAWLSGELKKLERRWALFARSERTGTTRLPNNR